MGKEPQEAKEPWVGHRWIRSLNTVKKAGSFHNQDLAECWLYAHPTANGKLETIVGVGAEGQELDTQPPVLMAQEKALSNNKSNFCVKWHYSSLVQMYKDKLLYKNCLAPFVSSDLISSPSDALTTQNLEHFGKFV